MDDGNKKEAGERMQTMQPPRPLQIPMHNIPKHNSIKVQEDNGGHAVIQYGKGLFTPHEITIKNEIGCFIEIQNADDTDVIPRLGPYNPKKETGFLYPNIPPHTKSLIDPRYGASSSEFFYNKNNPTADFIVHIDPTCLY